MASRPINGRDGSEIHDLGMGCGSPLPARVEVGIEERGAVERTGLLARFDDDLSWRHDGPAIGAAESFFGADADRFVRRRYSVECADARRHPRCVVPAVTDDDFEDDTAVLAYGDYTMRWHEYLEVMISLLEIFVFVKSKG
jgi:hypothetical protein